MFFLFLFDDGIAGGKEEIMAKFLIYEDQLEIKNGLKEYINT